MTQAGFRENEVSHVITQHERGNYPLIPLFHRDIIGPDMLNVNLKFESNGLDIRFHSGHAGLFHVPIDYQVNSNIEPVKLEERMQQVTWTHDHIFLMSEFPDDKEIAKLAKETVPGIYQDLAQLFNQSPAGRQLAEQLLVKQIAWHFASDRNDPLQELIGRKYYPTVELEKVSSPRSLYDLLVVKPIPQLDISAHIERFIERQLKYYSSINKTPIIMNYNNLENLKEEMTKLAFSKKTIDEMQKQMEKGVPEFTLNEQVKGNRGQVDLTLHFKQSGQSENYYFNKFEASLSNAKPLEEGQKYMVISPNPEVAGKNLVKPFVNVTEAISFFKEQKGDSVLAAGKDAAHKTELAKMEKGKINYVAKEFQVPFRAPAKTQTFFVERGKGFSAEQAANMIQGRAVYRDDLVNAAGEYKAWIKLDMDSPKDRYQNYQTNQYHVPTYGFDLESVLDKFKIKELDDPTKKEALIHSLQNGNRPLITTVKDGQDIKLHVEAVPRYSQLNMFQENGKPEKREQFLKEPALDKNINVGKAKEKEQEQGLGV
jgi:hypothetical protein